MQGNVWEVKPSPPDYLIESILEIVLLNGLGLNHLADFGVAFPEFIVNSCNYPKNIVIFNQILF